MSRSRPLKSARFTRAHSSAVESPMLVRTGVQPGARAAAIVAAKGSSWFSTAYFKPGSVNNLRFALP